MKASARAQLVEDVFLRCLDARRDFSQELTRCALKGWPDRSAPARTAGRIQELLFSQLAARLSQLVLQSGSDDTAWKNYTSTAKVQERLQDGWTEQEEQALRSSDSAYDQLQRDIIRLQAIADPQALEEPYKMAKRDSDLIAAAWKLNNTVLGLDRELAV